MRDRGGPDYALWTFTFGKKSGRPCCNHANFIDRHDGTLGADVNTAAEDEWLLSPYSAFTVTRAVWRDTPTTSSPHEVDLLVEVDNHDAPEDLPLSPWG